MNSRRAERAAEAIRETVSLTVLFGLRDPRVKNVTVLGAEVTADLRAAKIFVTIMGDAKAQSLAMHGLNSAKGFIQAKVADRLQTKYTPVISFVLDPSVKKSIEVSRMLQAVLPGNSAADSNDETAPAPLNNDADDDADYVTTAESPVAELDQPVVQLPTITGE